jgi:crossover junction endodeoxyribonuclease RuvC
MKIIGIDPGYDRLGIAVIEKGSNKKETLLFSECFQTSSKDTIYTRFKQVGEEVARVLEEYEPDELSIETLFIEKNQKTAMRVSEARGIILYEAWKKHVMIAEYTPLQIKMSVTGDGKSDKGHIYKMVSMLVNIPDSKTKRVDDEFDAIAVALTHSACRK